MHKITVVILSLTILLQSISIEAADIGKIPTLAAHIACHFETGDGFSDFISMHYGSNTNIQKNTHKEHSELPFKHEHLDAHIQIDFIFISNIITKKFEENIFSNQHFSYKEPSTEQYTYSFFQPPQK